MNKTKIYAFLYFVSISNGCFYTSEEQNICNISPYFEHLEQKNNKSLEQKNRMCNFSYFLWSLQISTTGVVTNLWCALNFMIFLVMWRNHKMLSFSNLVNGGYVLELWQPESPWWLYQLIFCWALNVIRKYHHHSIIAIVTFKLK